MIVTYCMACKDQFARAGAGTRHILELVYGTGDDTVPDLSRRRKNRLELKQKLLREIWKEDMRMRKCSLSVTRKEPWKRWKTA